MLHIHWLDKSFEPTLGTDLGVDFPDRDMAADFAFALYATLHGFDRAVRGFVLKDAGGKVVDEWRAGHDHHVDPEKPVAATTPIGAAIAALAVVPTLRKARRRLAAPWSPVIYRPLAAAVALFAILGNVGIGEAPVGASPRMASAEPVRPLVRANEGRSVYVAPVPSEHLAPLQSPHPVSVPTRTAQLDATPVVADDVPSEDFTPTHRRHHAHHRRWRW